MQWYVVQPGMLHDFDEARDLGVPKRVFLAVLLHVLEGFLQSLILLDCVAKLEVLVVPEDKPSVHMKSKIFPSKLALPVVHDLLVCGGDNVPHVWVGGGDLGCART